MHFVTLVRLPTLEKLLSAYNNPLYATSFTGADQSGFAYLFVGLVSFFSITDVASMPAPTVVFLWLTMVLWIFGRDLPLIGFCLN